METPILFVYDDGGREAAGFKGSAGDCVARAVAIASGLPYAKVYADLADLMAEMPKTKKRGRNAGRRSARNGVHTKSRFFKRYMEALGFRWTPTMSIGSGCRVHLKADELPGGTIIVGLSKHYAAVVDGVLRDTHDCSREGTRCVYGYWSKEGAAHA